MNKSGSIWRFFWPAVAFLVNFFHKLRYITQRDICLDEPWSIFHAQLPPSQIIPVLLKGNNPPLFELILHYWIQLFGIGPVAVRFLPLIFSSMVAAVLFRFCQKFFGWYAGLIAAILFTFNSMHYFFALEARVYSLLAMLTVLSIYAFISLFKYPHSKKHLVLLTISNILLGYAHYFGLLVVFTEVVLMIGFFALGQKKFTKQVLLSMGIFTLLYLPILINLIERYTSTVEGGTWVAPPNGVRELFLQPLAFFNGLYPLKKFGIVIVICLVLVLIYRWVSQLQPQIKIHKLYISAALLLFFLIPYCIMFFGSYKAPMFIIRYFLFTSVPLYLFCAATLHLLFNRYLVIYTVIVVFCGYYFIRSLEINPEHFYHREVKAAVDKVKELEAGDLNTPVFIHPSFTYIGFVYYYDRETFKNPGQTDSILEAKKIYPIWGFDKSKEVVEEQNPDAFIYYQDGSLASEGINYVQSQFDSLYVVDTTFFYQQTFYVTRFKKTSQTAKKNLQGLDSKNGL